MIVFTLPPILKKLMYFGNVQVRKNSCWGGGGGGGGGGELMNLVLEVCHIIALHNVKKILLLLTPTNALESPSLDSLNASKQIPPIMDLGHRLYELMLTIS